MDWIVSANMAAGELSKEHLERIADDPITSAYHNLEAGNVEIQLRVQADNHRQACERGLAAFDELANIGALVAEGVLAQPHNFDVITAEARARTLPLLGPAEVAARLGVTAARMRQLRQEYGERFPQPVKMLGIGDVYDAAEVDRFKRNVWRRQVGRPRRLEVVEDPHPDE